MCTGPSGGPTAIKKAVGFEPPTAFFVHLVNRSAHRRFSPGIPEIKTIIPGG
jgi:hypothetical protein